MTFVGVQACVDCHPKETAAWRGSHHDLAMQRATGQSVLGDFDDAVFEKSGVQSRFFRRDDGFWVETDNESGELQQYRIAYTFGVEPLQQYLIEFDRGRMQALPIAWDVQGERWFHLYPDEDIDHTDPLHWTGREQNWNYMCAECHSTGLEKNYTVKTESFATTWSEMNVSCEACHGPASKHVALAHDSAGEHPGGLLLRLDDHDGAVWQMNVERGIAERQPTQMALSKQPEACGRCHARRGLATPDYEYGVPLADTHTISLLEDPLYFADGQIREEVYVYGSFVQSKMYRAGVTCSDCHDPHSARLKTAGAVSSICSTCHLPDKFASESHHRHAAGVAECVDCHMPSRDFMVIDGRRDHSFRIPRPDLTPVTGAPSACNQCHADKDPEWAARAAIQWYGAPDPEHFSLALHAGRTGAADANYQLLAVAANGSHAGIVRATALTLLEPPVTTAQVRVLSERLEDPDPLLRAAALRALAVLPPEAQVNLATPLLDDRIRSVRLAAVSLLSPMRRELPVAYDAAFRNAEREYIRAQLAIAERPEAMTNLANLFRERGELEQSESYYRYALAQGPRLVTARSNLADLLRADGRDGEAEIVLRAGLELDADDGVLRHSLGLLLVRAGDPEMALAELQKAAALEPDNSRFVYVYGVALDSLGRKPEAVAVMRDASSRFPGDLDIGLAYVTYLSQAGETEESMRVLQDLQRRYPENAQVRSLAQFILGQ